MNTLLQVNAQYRYFRLFEIWVVLFFFSSDVLGKRSAGDEWCECVPYRTRRTLYETVFVRLSFWRSLKKIENIRVLDLFSLEIKSFFVDIFVQIGMIFVDTTFDFFTNTFFPHQILSDFKSDLTSDFDKIQQFFNCNVVHYFQILNIYGSGISMHFAFHSKPIAKTLIWSKIQFVYFGREFNCEF